MKRLSLLVPVMLATVLLLNGCAFMGDEDRDFYGKGWVHPRDLDTDANYRPPKPGKTTAASESPADAEGDSAWNAPVR